MVSKLPKINGRGEHKTDRETGVSGSEKQALIRRELCLIVGFTEKLEQK